MRPELRLDQRRLGQRLEQRLGQRLERRLERLGQRLEQRLGQLLSGDLFNSVDCTVDFAILSLVQFCSVTINCSLFCLRSSIMVLLS